MGRKSNNRKVSKSNAGSSIESRKVNEPNAQIRSLYDERKNMSVNEILSLLNNMWSNTGRIKKKPHPIDTELTWLVIGSICDKSVTDDELRRMGKIIENSKLYQQFGLCCSHILDMDFGNSDKKIKLERLLVALCKATALYLEVASLTDVSKTIRRNFFLDLYNSTQDPSIQVLEIKPRIIQRLEQIHLLLAGNDSREDSGVEMTDSTSQSPSVKPISYTTPPNDIMDLNIVPTHQDISLTGKTFLRPNFVGHPYPDLETYKDVQFRLLMEDFMAPLREGVAKFFKEDFGPKGIQELHIYEIETLKFLPDPRFVPERETAWRFYGVKFKTLRRVNWATSRRLIHGSLVCLWDGMNELVVASVANSNPDELDLGYVVLVLETQRLPSHTKKWVMLESAVFFEPYRAVLQVLQNFTYDTFPMMEYLLGYEKNQLPPSYVVNSSDFTLQLMGGKTASVRNMMEFRMWPDAEQLGLDSRQHKALLIALTSRLSLIQGPPGTGKTFLALRILRSLLDNKSLWQGKFTGVQEMMSQHMKVDEVVNWYGKNKYVWKKYGDKCRDERAPVVVICFTNHALDQFLEGISNTTNKIIRIGGQSKSPKLEELNLNKIKYQAKSVHDNGPYKDSTYFYYFHRMKEVRALMEVLYGQIQATIRLTQSMHVLKVSELRKKNIISSEICDAFIRAEKRQLQLKRKSSSILKWWLGWSNHRQLNKVLREIRMDTRKAQVAKAAAAVKEEKMEEYLPEDTEVPNRLDDDMVEDFIDDEDYREELRLAQERADVVASTDEFVNDNDDFQLRLDAAIDDEDQSVVDFTKNQTQRMQSIRDLLMALPPNPSLTESVSADEILILPLSQRWMLFAHWKRMYQEEVYQELMETQKKYENSIKEFNQLKGQALAALCRTADVIGMTTTGAAKNRLLLESLKAKIVIVEEAAEVLESHIVCSLTADCQQLIMIGDHQQLRPSVNVHQLATKYKLDVSLFERLIVGNMKPERLGVQHRMRAEVARLIVPAVYAHLENHSSVYSHPHVPGMQHDVFFYHHTNPEKEDGSSFYNTHEVVMALHLALYLVREHGVSPNRITILATYTAQLHQLLNFRRQNSVMRNELSSVRTTVVDNFQGEENDIIILSLVRNNNRNSVGFLRIDNRVCVALSRARNGLFILGNIRMLASSSPLWAHMEQVLTEHGEIGEEFPLRCDRHHQTIQKVKKPEEFLAGISCSVPCGALLNCGHACQRVCHRQGVHTQSCQELVIKQLACGHRQAIVCSKSTNGEPCRQPVPLIMEPCMHGIEVQCSKQKSLTNIQCTYLMPKQLPCGHVQLLRCCDPLDPTLCQIQVEFKLMCSHVIPIACGTPLTRRILLHMSCQQQTRKTLPCGHLKMMPCRDDPSETDCGRLEERILDCGHKLQLECPGLPADAIAFICSKIVDHLLPCGHTQKNPCFRPPDRCNQVVERKLKCGHTVKAACWDQLPVCSVKVEKMLMCGHENLVSCSDRIDWVICTAQVEVIHPVCSHLQLVSCAIVKDELQLRLHKCLAEPLKTLNCGHELRLPCSQEVDDNIVCKTMVNYMLPCDHEVIIPCHSIEYRVKEKCKLDCRAPLECEHFCSLPCHDNTVAHACNRNVDKKLGCGHSKEMPCFRDPAKEICFKPVSSKRACGHIWATTCGEMSSVVESVCNEQKEKYLPCGHKVRVKCSQPLEEIICNEPDVQVLGCRHSVATKCGVPLEKRLLLPCTKELARQLPCGHDCIVKCGSKEAEKPVANLFCRSIVEKKIPQCGHTIQIECGKNLSKNDCTSLCEKTLDCGHRCPLPCREPCSTKSCCQEVELEDIKLPCGHFFRAECRLRYADRDVIEAKKIEMGKCRFRCPFKLACGHECTSTCNECVTNKFHSVCTKRCDRTLICGHKCEAQCGKACPPCKKPCGYQCSHQKCPLLCGEECTPCMKNCEWKCPHEQCNHLCYEFCNREPCNKPCPKVLNCGHHCNGLCGEICPPQCHNCSSVKISKYNKKFRYIYLDCGHCIEVYTMDEWLDPYNKKEEQFHKIECPTCPQCKKAMRQSFRYGDSVIALFWERLLRLKIKSLNY